MFGWRSRLSWVHEHNGSENVSRIKSKLAKYYRLQMAALMLIADLAGFGLAGILVYWINQSFHFFSFAWVDAKYLIVVLLSLALFISSRLYPGVGINPADEIRLVTQFVSIGFMLGFVIFMMILPEWKLNHWALLPAWAISILLLLLARWSVRILAVRWGLWGEPVVVIGQGPQMQRLAQYFFNRRRLGFIPVLAADGVTSASRKTVTSIPVIDIKNLANLPDDYFSRNQIQTAFVDLSTVPTFSQPEISHSLFRLFRQVIFISDADWLEGATLGIRDFEGLIGVEAGKSAITPAEMALKRGVDVTLSFLGGLLLLPFFLALAVLIKLDSPGPVLYSQERVGKDGKKIRVYKFRSMRQDAEQTLAVFLARNEQARLEWEQCKKLKDDPRCTRLGKWIRKFSIDEFPQLYNVLKGDMSLVGPRPLPEYHHNTLSEKARHLRREVSPGLTGMWQVSGRSNTGDLELEMWDLYYVHNWSIWLDVYILLRTLWEVLTKDGPYRPIFLSA